MKYLLRLQISVKSEKECHALKIPQNSGENTRRLPPHATKIDTFFAYLADVQNLQKHRNKK